MFCLWIRNIPPPFSSDAAAADLDIQLASFIPLAGIVFSDALFNVLANCIGKFARVPCVNQAREARLNNILRTTAADLLEHGGT